MSDNSAYDIRWELSHFKKYNIGLSVKYKEDLFDCVSRDFTLSITAGLIGISHSAPFKLDLWKILDR